MKKRDTNRELLEILSAFIIAFLAYQALSLLTGTSLPIVSVVSDSMYHTNHFDAWWLENGGLYSQYNIDKDTFKTFVMPNGLSKGDLLFVVHANEPKVGDILIYKRNGSPLTIVHRLVSIEEDHYIIKGDNNKQADASVNKEYVIGKVVFGVPVLGYPRLLLHAVGV